MRPNTIRMSGVAIAMLLSTMPVSALAMEPPTYDRAPGVRFESVAPSVWKVVDTAAPGGRTGEYPEWHRGMEVAADGTAWVWGPGGIRELGGTPIGDDPADWADSVAGISSKARGFSLGVDGTVWAIIDSKLQSWDGSTWAIHELDWPAVAPPDLDDVYCTMVEALPDGSVWAAWEIWYDEGYQYEQVLASFDGDDWTVERIAAKPRAISPVAGTPAGEAWVVVATENDRILMHRHQGGWRPVHPPAIPAGSGPAMGPDGSLWMTVLRTADADGCDALARLRDGQWSVEDPESDAMCVIGLFGLEAGADGSVWFASDGVSAFDGAEWQHYLRGTFVLDIDVARDGAVWVAAAEGVYVIRPPTMG